MGGVEGIRFLEGSGQGMLPFREYSVGAQILADIAVRGMLQGADDAVIADQRDLFVVTQHHLTIIVGKKIRVERSKNYSSE